MVEGGCWVGNTVTHFQCFNNDSTGHFLQPLQLQFTDILWVSLLLLSGLQVQSRPMLELGLKQGLNNSRERNWEKYCSTVYPGREYCEGN